MGCGGTPRATSQGMTTDLTRHASVVVAYDFTECSNPALARALAGVLRSPRVLHVLCVLEPNKTYADAELVQKNLTAAIRAAAEVANLTSDFEFFAHVRIGNPAGQILDLAREVGADAIVMGCRGLVGTDRLLHGSVSGRVAREARCLVEIARPKQYADVELLQVIEVEPAHHHPAPFRFSYERHDVLTRPNDWPLY